MPESGDQRRIDLQLEVWKQTIDVQKHFNDIEMRIRGLALTVLTAILGAAAIAARYGLRISFRGTDVQLGTVVLFIGAFVWWAFYSMDKHWYHRLLQGAVTHAQAIEDDLKDEVPNIGLSSTIGAASPYKSFLRGKAVHSDQKIRRFYGAMLVVLVVSAVLLQVGNPEVPGSKDLPVDEKQPAELKPAD